MQSLLIQLFTLLSLLSPAAGCKKESTAGEVYTVSQKGPNRDSVNATVSGSRRNAITAAVAKASPAVVGINVTEIKNVQVDPFGGGFGGWSPFLYTQRAKVKALGSGFIISPDGYVLTNDHVAGEALKIIVTTTDGSEYDAKLIGTDRLSDVSLLKIDKTGLPYLKLGNSDDLAVGEWAIAMGNPFGLFSINDKPTVTVGVISNTNVNLGVEEGRNYRGMIQTDAAISSGNSGGPLLNANGEVVGMNATIRSTAVVRTEGGGEQAGSIGLGFAIPVNKIKEVVDRLRGGESVNHNIGNLGMGFRDLTDDYKEYLNIKSNVGVVVDPLYRGGLAERAGFKAGDLIVALNDEKVRSADGLTSAIFDHEVGETVTFHIVREGKNMDIKMKLPGAK